MNRFVDFLGIAGLIIDFWNFVAAADELLQNSPNMKYRVSPQISTRPSKFRRKSRGVVNLGESEPI